MAGSAVVYTGLVCALAGLVLCARPSRRLLVPTRARAVAVAAAGTLVAAVGLVLPAAASRVARAETRLDAFAPVWQFRELHERRIAAPPARVFEAVRRVRADEILFFRALTWLRRGGRPLPSTILDAGGDEPLIDVALRGGFVRLAEDPHRELVVGTAILRPPDWQGPLTPEVFETPRSPGWVLAAMNFLVRPDGGGGTIVSTETRVYASSSGARRRFAAYWRLIYPGSALIRRMWLRAIDRRATRASGPAAKSGDSVSP